MTVVDRWLLPDGIEELLPSEALKVEQLRRRILDLYNRWGYDLVVPPLVEFTESLLSGVGPDLNLLTFKLTDQISGRTMGIRADVTPQTTRMDAHSLRRNGPNRLCYAATVLYSRQRTPLESRCPIQIGVELYGESGLAADIEVVSLMIETLQLSGITEVSLDLGHVGIYCSLLETAALNREREAELFDLLQRKAAAELDVWLRDNIDDEAVAGWMRTLVELSGDRTVLDRARAAYAEAPAEVELALDELAELVNAISTMYPQVDIYLDLGELCGYHYHTGIVFAAFVRDGGPAVGNGGRYDHVGEAFGRARPATGFNMNLKVLASLAPDLQVNKPGIFAPASEDPQQRRAIDELRRSGERVVAGFPGQRPDYRELNCDRELCLSKGAYSVQPIKLK